MRKGEWRAEAPFDGIAGFHLNEVYSSWVRLEAMVRTFLSAKDHGDEAMKTFVNTSLGETWVETGEAPDWQRLYDRREAWPAGTVPMGGLFLTAGADVQKDRIEVDRLGLGPRAGELAGRPHRHRGRARARRRPGRRWTALLGRSLAARLGARRWGWQGSRSTPATRRRPSMPGPGAPGSRRWRRSRASRASTGRARSPGPTYVDATDGGKRLRRGARLWTVAVSTFKTETYRYPPSRAADRRGARRTAPAFPPAPSICQPGPTAEWCKQFVAEQLVTVKTKRGFTRLEWQKLRERNEALDCRVYARAAAWIAGADRWRERKWRDLEAQVDARGSRTTKRPRGA